MKASVGKFMCGVGAPRWVRERDPEGGATYLECERCREQKDTVALDDIEGSG